MFNDYLSIPENVLSYAGCHAESVFQLLWVQSQARSRSHGLLSKEESWQPTGFSQDCWPAPGSLMVTHLDHHPSRQPLTVQFLLRSGVRDPGVPSFSLDEASHPLSRVLGNKGAIRSN